MSDPLRIARTPFKRKRPRRGDAIQPGVWGLVCLHIFSGLAAVGADSTQQQQQQQYDGTETYSENHGLQTVARYCQKRLVEVQDVRLTCDSPGAYYYGSKTYRSSEVCFYGDKVNVNAQVTISDKLDSNNAIYLQVNAGLYGNIQQVIASTRLCQLQIQAMDGSNQNCPQSGDYLLQTSFYLPQLVGDIQDFHFTPDVNLTFTDGSGSRLGCVVTGAPAAHLHADRRGTMGMVALGLALAVFTFVLGGLLILARRRRKRLESLAERKTQRYQYFRTLPNGQVVPISHAQTTAAPAQSYQPRQLPSGGPSDAYHISNPAYNETQLPTRPVI